MRIFHHEAITMPDYTRDCYNDQFHLKNHDWLGLVVAPVCFKLGRELMTVIPNVFDQNRMAHEGDNAPQNARAEVNAARKRLQVMFPDCANEFESLDKQGK
jgi:hypothetical protein